MHIPKASVILSLDLATVTGYAVGTPGQPPMFGHVRFIKPGGSRAAAYRAFRAWLDRTWATYSPDLVVYESPAIPSFMGGKTNIDTTRLLFGLVAHLEEWAHDRVELREATTAQVRCHFIGRNFRAKIAKPMVLERCHELGWMAATHDESDALALWDYEVCMLVPELAMRTTRLFQQKSV